MEASYIMRTTLTRSLGRGSDVTGAKWHVIAPSGCTLRDEPDGRPQQHLDFGTILEVESKLEHEAGVFISQPTRGWIALEDDVKGGIGIAPGDERCAAQWRLAQRYCSAVCGHTDHASAVQ
jgi:hypothetical protein